MQMSLDRPQENVEEAEEQLMTPDEENFHDFNELVDFSSSSQELNSAFEEKDVFLEETHDSKNIYDTDAKKVKDLSSELNSVKESLANINGELDAKDKNIESLKLELEKAKAIEIELSEKTASLEKLKQKLSSTIESESLAMELLAECKVRIQTLESETEKAKESETKIFDSLLSQTRQFEQTKILLEEAKLEIASLREKIDNLDDTTDFDVPHHGNLDNHPMKDTVKILTSELQIAKECLARAQEEEQLALSKAHRLDEEMSTLRNELKSALEAEENSKKAMDDLALFLKEVSTEAMEVKEKLNSTQYEMGMAKEDAEQSKLMMKNTGNELNTLLDEANKELDQVKETVERLKIEAEESVMAWNVKEIEFINCIKRAEEETISAKQENGKLKESLKVAEDSSKVSREENHKLRDILKQAINESNVAKEAAGIAQTENSLLKDIILDKDNALMMLSKENKQLRINETAAMENIKELKRLLSMASTNDLKAVEKESGRVLKKQNSNVEEEHKDNKKLALKKQNSNKEEEHKDNRKLAKALSLTIDDLRVPNRNIFKKEDDDPERTETLKGSIFDVDSPEPVSHHRKQSSTFIADDGETAISEDFDHLDPSHFDDMESDRSSQRKKKALLWRVGALLRKKSFHKRDPSMG